MRLVGHVIALKPNSDQVGRFLRAAGCARFAYNWGLQRWKERFQAGEKPNWMAVQREFVARIDSDFPFMREVPSSAYSQPFRHLHQAFQRFFAGAGYPRFKSKQRETPSFKLRTVRFQGGHVILPVIGAVRIQEEPRFAGRIISATVTADADRWTISVQFELPDPATPPPEPTATSLAVGIDLGLRTFATCSDGARYLAPKPLRRHQRCLHRRQRALARCVRSSKRRQRAKMRVARLHRRIRNIRSAFLHHVTTSIVRKNHAIVIEDLHITGMLKNHTLARAISDVAWHEFRRQLTYKCIAYQRSLYLADRFEPSSRRCVRCKAINAALTLSDTVFQCPHCGYREDRDLNAAENLSTLAWRGSDARGELQALVEGGQTLRQPARGSVNPGAAKAAKNRQPELSG